MDKILKRMYLSLCVCVCVCFTHIDASALMCAVPEWRPEEGAGSPETGVMDGAGNGTQVLCKSS